MRDMRLWDKTSNVNLMGQEHTPAQLQAAYPMQTDGECVLEYVSPHIVGGIDNLQILAQVWNIPVTTPQETLDAILAAMEVPPEPSAEERIAAAMEYQNLLSM